MPLQKQSFNLNFAQGLDQKMDPFQLRPGKFTSLKNRVFNKGGRLDKRNGYSALGTSVATPVGSYGFSQIPGTLAAGRNISTFNDELILNDGLNLYSRSTTANNVVYKGRSELCAVSSQSVYRSQNTSVSQDSALNSTLGLNLFAWENWTGDPYKTASDFAGGSALSGVQLTLVDSTTEQNVFTSQLASNTSRPKCISISNKLYVLYYNSGDNKIYAQSVTQTGLGVATAIITNINTTNVNYDVLVIGSNFCVAYNGTGTTVKAALFDSSLVAGNTVSKATESASNGVCLFTDDIGNIWIGYNNGTATKAFIMNSTLVTTVLAPTAVDGGAGLAHNVTGIYDSAVSKGIFFYDVQNGPALGQLFGYTIAAAQSFTQPAVGATITTSLTGPGGLNDYTKFTQNNQIIYIPTGGYYWITGAIVGAAVVGLTNLGFPANAAPGATVAGSTQPVYPTLGFYEAYTTFNTLTVGGTAGTPASYCRSLCLASRAFIVNSTPHVILAHDSLTQPNYFITALYNTSSGIAPAAIVGKLAENAGGGMPFRMLLPSVNAVSSGKLQSALLSRTFEIQQTSNNTANVTYNLGIFSGSIDFTTNDIQTNQLGNNLQIGSGVVQMYDGAVVVEQGFHIFPEVVFGTASGGDSGLGDGTYGYKAVYEWIDNQGQTHRSAPSPVLSITLSASNHVALQFPTLCATEKKNVTIALYRTTANGSVYYRLDTQYFLPINNDITTDLVSFTDYSADASIVGNEQLYTAQEVENIGPPAANVMGDFKNRLIIVPVDSTYEFWYSKQVIPGSPVEFSDLFVQNVGTVGGALKAVTKLDDKLILFKKSSIYYMTGTGPSPSGANNDFTDPQFVTADAGLLDLRSIVTTPVGIMFKSAKGIYLLDRSLQARYIGAAVEDYNQYTVYSADLIPTQNQVRFILSSGQALVYDYYWTDESGIGQWAVFDNIAGVSSTIYQSLATFITSTGQVYQESVGSYLDGATAVNTSFKTAWINMAGLQGYERAYFFYFLAQYISAHTLTINLYYNYDSTTVAQTLTITPNATDLEQWRVFLSNQKCESFLIEVQEGNSSGAGFTMSGLDIMVGIKKGYTTIKAAASAS